MTAPVAATASSGTASSGTASSGTVSPGTVRAPPGAATAARAPGGQADAERRPPLGREPAPDPAQAGAAVDGSVVDHGGAPAGGLAARCAEWGVDGGAVLLTGEAPFVDVTGRAGFRSDGSLDGTVALSAAVRLLGLPVAEVRWSVTGWTPDAPLPLPAVQLRGTTLDLDVTAVGVPARIEPAPGLAVTSTEAGAIVSLPADALPPSALLDGRPLEPRVVELMRGLHGWDVTPLRAHPDSELPRVAGADAHLSGYVSGTDLFFAPGWYGADSPDAAALLDAAIRAALAGTDGPVTATPPAPPPQPAPDEAAPPAAETTVVPAAVEPVPAVPLAAARAPDEGAAQPGVAPGPAPVVDLGETVPAGEAAAAATGPTAVPPAAATAGPELLMPPAPAMPGPAATARAAAVGRAGAAVSRVARDLPPAEADVAGARGAVTEPVAETAARARGDLAAALGDRPPPAPAIEALCQRIRTAIREHRPLDEDQLLRTDPTQEARAAGETLTGSVQGQAEQVQGSYDAMGAPAGGSPALAPTPVTDPSTATPDLDVAASSAAPDPVPAENLSLAADVAATDQRIADAGVDTRVTREIPAEPFSAVREGRGDLGELAERTPAELAAQQTAAIERSQADLAAIQAQAVEALRTARAGTVGGVARGQAGMVGTEQRTREAAGQRAQQVFAAAQTQVQALLQPLTRTAIARWEAGLTRLSQEFHDALNRVQAWIDERHRGVDGFFVAIGDAVLGLPDWVVREYDRAERAFGDGVCALLREISSDVTAVVAAAQAIVAQARSDIDAVFDAMAADFPEWTAQERARFAGLLDGLSQRATATQTGFVTDVSRRATQAVGEVQAAVEERRAAARGVVGRIAQAIDAFLADPVRAIIDGLLALVGIPPAAFWALVARIQRVAADIAADPERFVNNLVAGVRRGFEQFFDRFGSHVLQGFWDWLFSGLDVPIPMPTSFSPRSLFSFALQLMGITWPRVREILVRHVGEQNVALAEAAWNVISAIVERGPDGLVEMIKERLTPEVIVQAILEAAVEYLIETLVQQVIVRVIGMLNPVGAVAQAIDLVYQVCAWIFRNAARIFRFVEAVVNGMADVVAGNIGGLANAVERALAMLIPPVIDFLAGLLHLGGLPNRVAEVITGLQQRVYQVLDVVIGFLVERGRALLRTLGIGGEEGAQPGAVDEELGTTVRFTAAGRAHRLWVQTAGPEATLMVASVPQPIADTVAYWRGQLAAGVPADEALRAEASSTLGNLTTVADEADAEGDRLAVLFLQAAAERGDDVRPPSDDALENRERAIAGMLDRLFTIFEGRASTEQWLHDMREQLPGEGDRRMGDVYPDWRARLAQFRIGNEPGDDRLWPDTVLDGTQAPARTLIGAAATHQLLLPYFQTAPGQRSVSTAFFQYVFAQSSAPHSVRRQFRQAYGIPAVANLTSQGLANVNATTKVDEQTKQRWRDRLALLSFEWEAPGGGRIAWPTERVPDHTRFRPIMISETESGGVRTVVYRTEPGQTFTSTTDARNGLTITVTGRELRFQSGRGVTEDSPAFRTNNGFDRSHIIANEFGGTGFAVGGNLVTASAHYNQNVMRAAERSIGTAVAAVAATHGLDETTVSFDMTVTVRFGALRDPAALAAIKAQPWFPADRAGTDLDAEIVAKINAGEVHPDLMRIVSVTYEWTFTDPAGPGGTLPIGPDLWLLMDG